MPISGENPHDTTSSKDIGENNDNVSRIDALGKRLALSTAGNADQARTELREIIRQCLDSGMDDALHLSLEQAREASEGATASCIEGTIEDEAQCPLVNNSANNPPTVGCLFAIPVLIYSDRPFLVRSIRASECLDSLINSFHSSGLVDEEASVHLARYLYTPEELWSLTWSQVRALPSKIAGANGDVVSAAVGGLCRAGDVGMAFPGDNFRLNLRYMLGVVTRPAGPDFLASEKSATPLKSLDERKMTTWSEAATTDLERALHEPGKEPLIDVIEPHPFYQALRQGANAYNILSFMLQFDDLLRTNRLEPEDVSAIVALYHDSDGNVTARASLYTYVDEQLIGGCSYEVYPFEDANDAIMTIEEYLAEQGVADYSFVSETLGDSVCEECGEPRLIGPHPGDGKDHTLGLVHSHWLPKH